MKENRKRLYGSGDELLHINPMSVNTMRDYWKGSPWRALRDCVRGV